MLTARAAFTFAMIGILGGVSGLGTPWLAAWGLAAALAAVACGLAMALADDTVENRAYRGEVWARRDAEQGDEVLTYRPPVRTDVVYRTPVWPNEVGAPE
jgi:hypothetical protein